MSNTDKCECGHIRGDHRWNSKACYHDLYESCECQAFKEALSVPDDLARDILQIFQDSNNWIMTDDCSPDSNGMSDLIQGLVMYIVQRDHKVHDAGVELGKQIATGDIEPDEEEGE